jgi:hypothetical protein
MSQAKNRSVTAQFTRFFRRFLAKPLRALSRTGKIAQTLWDAAQLQSQQKAYYQRIGEMTIRLVREGRLSHMGIERTMTKIDQIERVLNRQELILRSYQSKTDIREVLKQDRQKHKDELEPV